MYRVIFFDLDETLVSQEAAFKRAYRSMGEYLSREVVRAEPAIVADAIPVAAERALGASCLVSTVRRCCFGGRDLLWGDPGAGPGASREIAREIERFRVSAWCALLEGFAVTRPDHDVPWVAAELSQRFRAAMLATLGLFPDVVSALERLAREYRLAVITNGMGGAQREKLAHLDIARYFQAVIASAEVGEGKPGGGVFREAMRVMGVEAGGAVMIGDSLEGDVLGARSAGLDSVWLNRLSGSTEGESAHITSLAGWSPGYAPTKGPTQITGRSR